MTRKDDVLLADALRRSRPAADAYSVKWEQWEIAVRYMADALRDTNPCFDSVRFIKACEA